MISVTKQCVAFLYGERMGDSGLEKVPVGTCFFAGRATDERKSVYLVTARHVYDQLIGGDSESGRIFVRLNVEQPSLGVEYVPLPTEGWIPHPDDQVDLMVLPWFPFIQNVDAERNVSGTIMSIPLDVMANARRIASEIDKPWPPEEGEEVFFVGLLLIHEGKGRNFPVFRRGHVALNSDEVMDLTKGKSHYRLIEATCYDGNSGAPVWAYYEPAGRRPRWIFLGVLTLGFKSEPDQVGGKKTFSYGISAVVPGDYLVEMLMALEEEKANEPKKGRDRGTPLSVGDSEPAELTKEAMESALRKVSRGDGKEVIEKLDQASSEI